MISEAPKFELNWQESKPEYREELDRELANSPLISKADNAACGWLFFEDLEQEELANVFRLLADIFDAAADSIEESTGSSKGGTE